MKELPKNFSIQSAGIEHHAGNVKKGRRYLIQYFRRHPEEAKKVLIQSYDKRFSPSTFVEELGKKFAVGWFDSEREFVREFDNLEEAITDYLLFSFGEERKT